LTLVDSGARVSTITYELIPLSYELFIPLKFSSVPLTNSQSIVVGLLIFQLSSITLHLCIQFTYFEISLFNVFWDQIFTNKTVALFIVMTPLFLLKLMEYKNPAYLQSSAQAGTSGITTNAVTDLNKTAAPTIRQFPKQSFQETQSKSIPIHLSVEPKPVECMTPTSSPKENHVYYQVNVEIPAKSTILISVCLKSSSKSRYFLFNPNIKLAQFNIIVTTGVIRRKQTTLPITMSILNPSI